MEKIILTIMAVGSIVSFIAFLFLFLATHTSFLKEFIFM